MTEYENMMVDGAAMCAAAVMKYPLLFTIRLMEHLWRL